MARRPNPALVGAFILGGILLIVAAIVVWGSGRFFETRYRYVCYFSGSVNGLAVGAPVKYRGVGIGSVVEMRVRYAQGSDDTRIPIIIELYGKRLRELGESREPRGALLDDLIARGLRARLETLSLVTGQLYINLDLFPDSAPPQFRHRGEYPEIPTMPAAMEEATRSLTALLRQLQEADIAGTARSLAGAVEGINQIVHTPAIHATLVELPSTVASYRQLARTMDSKVSDLSKELSSTVTELREALAGTRNLTASRGPVMTELQRTLLEVQKAADAVRTLAEYLQRNPNALIVGKKRP
jgi:paraquat-inducible protein B